MLEFASPRIIRPAEPRDIEPLKTALPKREPNRDVERLAMQGRGEAVYLLAVQDDIPVGRLLLQWGGAKDVPSGEGVATDAPAIEDLFVLKEHRNRKVVSRLLESAERLAAERGYKQIGLSFGTEDTAARDLYEKHGYVDTGVPPYTVGGKYTDAEGKEQEWTEEVVYLVHPLTTPTPAAETENEMTSDEQSGNETSPTISAETAQTATATEEPVTVSEPKPTNEKPLTDQVVDFAFGVALTAAEVLEKAVEALSEKAKIAQKEAPAVWEAMQDKGRPAREKLVQSLREETKEETDAATSATAVKTSEPPVESEAKSETKPLTVEPTPIKPAPRPFGFGRTSALSAEDEIKALEDRVKALEQEVAITPAPTSPIVDTLDQGPEVVEDVINAAAPTPAEEGTAQVYFTTETTADALSDSAYAVVDDEERAEMPSQSGELVETQEPVVEVALAAPRSRRTKKNAEATNETSETETVAESELEEPAA